jgi:EAL domain-containing protein (putative c-di-GMP-specific phosphodiesterase class I)/CheY-like chemotaxis protein
MQSSGETHAQRLRRGEAATPSESSRPSVNDRPPVLVVDDDESIRAFFRAALDRKGFRVLQASNGREALELIRAGTPVEVMLLDLHMPEMDGIATLHELRSDPVHRTLPVILVTGSTTEAERIRGLDRGADDVVVKPVSVTEIVARIRAQIRGRTALTHQQEARREHRRRLTAFLPELPRDASLLTLAAALTEGLPDILGVDTAAILVFERGGGTRCVSVAGLLAERYRPGKPVAHDEGVEIARRSKTGAWLDTPTGPLDDGEGAVELAFAPFSLGSSASPIGCLVYGRRFDQAAGPMSHLLPDLVDATDLIVTVLQPAIEHAETTNTAILGLRRIISRRGFAMALQPIVHMESGAVIAVEALARFADGVRPDIRFAEAARLGMGAALERAAVAEAIKAARSLPLGVALSVNISPDVLQHDDEMPQIIAEAERPIIIELTEHERIDDYDAVRRAYARLGPNVRLAVDDAGSGYASLRHIFSLQPAYVKLDIEWVRGIGGDPIRRALVSGMRYFAEETGCELIAEGIEEEDERKALLELGIKLGQGFLLGRPEVPPAA